MKKFLLRICIFALVMVSCDVMMGFVGSYLVHNAKGGETARKNYIANETIEDVLIFGSSRALHHYDPNILEDSLGLTTYNCGFEGNGVICAYGFFKMINDRYHPKVIIYDIFSVVDIESGDNNVYLGSLHNFYDRMGIDSIFWEVENIERYKMISNLYRFNSVLPQTIMDNLHPLASDDKGYRPTDREMEYEPLILADYGDCEYDSLKLHYIERIIKECKDNAQLIFTVSPMYGKIDDKMLAPIVALCEKYDVPLLNHLSDTTFHYRRKYFHDSVHLNRTGATAYSKTIASEVKNLLKK